jgi:hypothetical protein
MQLNRLLVSKKELKTLGIPYSFQHIARLERAGKFPHRIMLGQCQDVPLPWFLIGRKLASIRIWLRVLARRKSAKSKSVG